MEIFAQVLQVVAFVRYDILKKESLVKEFGEKNQLTS
jgi:hypothetical protein